MNEIPGASRPVEPSGRNNTALDEEPRGSLVRTTVIALVLLAVGAAILVTTYDLHRVRSATMLPTLPVAGLGVYRPVSSPSDIERGDIVRFRSDWPDAVGFPELTFRVIGLGGDRVAGERNGTLSVNGRKIDEPYVDASNSAVQPEFEVVVPQGRLFLAGDGRSMAFDSRLRLSESHSGTVSAGSVSGRLVGVGWPVWHWSIPDSDRGTPWPFVTASVLIGMGALLATGTLFRALAALIRTTRRLILRSS